MSSCSITRKRISWDPHRRMGVLGKLYWCCQIKWVLFPTSQCPISICLTMEKVQLVLSRAKTKASVQSVCSILKSSPVQHPASLACVSSCSSLLRCGVEAPSWSLWVESTGPWAMWLPRPLGCGERMCEGMEWMQTTERAREREKELLFPLGLY